MLVMFRAAESAPNSNNLITSPLPGFYSRSRRGCVGSPPEPVGVCTLSAMASETVQVRDMNGNVATRTRTQWERLDKPRGYTLATDDPKPTKRTKRTTETADTEE